MSDLFDILSGGQLLSDVMIPPGRNTWVGLVQPCCLGRRLVEAALQLRHCKHPVGFVKSAHRQQPGPAVPDLHAMPVHKGVQGSCITPCKAQQSSPLMHLAPGRWGCSKGIWAPRAQGRQRGAPAQGYPGGDVQRRQQVTFSAQATRSSNQGYAQAWCQPCRSSLAAATPVHSLLLHIVADGMDSACSLSMARSRGRSEDARACFRVTALHAARDARPITHGARPEASRRFWCMVQGTTCLGSHDCLGPGITRSPQPQRG